MVYICLIIYFIRLSIVVYEDSKVEKVSEKYKKLLEINEKYKFQEYKNKFTINHYAKSKRSLDKVSLQDLVKYNIENNTDYIFNTIQIIRMNKKRYENYE